jgi:hypothetical protein
MNDNENQNDQSIPDHDRVGDDHMQTPHHDQRQHPGRRIEEQPPGSDRTSPRERLTDFAGGFLLTALLLAGLYYVFTQVLAVPAVASGGLLSHGIMAYITAGFLLGTASIMLPHRLVLPIGGVFALSGLAALASIGDHAAFIRVFAFTIAGATPWGVRAAYDSWYYLLKDHPDHAETVDDLTPGNMNPREQEHPNTGRGLAYLAVQAIQHAMLRRVPNPGQHEGVRKQLDPDNRVKPAEDDIQFEGSLNALDEDGYDPAIHGNQPPQEQDREQAQQPAQQGHGPDQRGAEQPGQQRQPEPQHGGSGFEDLGAQIQPDETGIEITDNDQPRTDADEDAWPWPENEQEE